MWRRGPRPRRRGLERVELGTGRSGEPLAAGCLGCLLVHNLANQRDRGQTGAALRTGLGDREKKWSGVPGIGGGRRVGTTRGRATAGSRWLVSGAGSGRGRREAGVAGLQGPSAGAAAHCASRSARSVADEPRPGRVDPTLPRPGRVARSSPGEPELFGPIPGDYAREPTNQLHQLMNIYDLG